MRHPKSVLIAILASVLLSGTAFGLFRYANAQDSSKTDQTYTAKRQTLTETLTVSGTLDAERTAILRFQSSGLLTWVGVKEGDMVKEGQAIASLDKRDISNRLKKYLLAYDKTRWNFEAVKDGYKDSPYLGLSEDARREADRTFEKAQFDLDSSVLDVELQHLALTMSTLTTPIAGLVARVDTPYAGVNVTPATGEFEIIDPQSIYMSVLADQAEVPKLSPGMKADIVLDAFPDRKLTGTVRTISFTPKVGETNTVYEVKIAMAPGSDFRMGMTGDATFETSSRNNILSVPNQYVKSEGDKKFVWKAVSGKKTKTFVKVGVETDAMTEITSGLKPGDILYD